MSREIKFRGLRTDGKGWVYGYYWYDNQNKKHKITIDLPDDNFRCHEVKPESVGQYTGLKDLNGKEIYEGDLVNVPYNYIGIIEVEYIDEECRFSISMYNISSLEIIGNIHEQ